VREDGAREGVIDALTERHNGLLVQPANRVGVAQRVKNSELARCELSTCSNLNLSAQAMTGRQMNWSVATMMAIITASPQIIARVLPLRRRSAGRSRAGSGSRGRRARTSRMP